MTRSALVTVSVTIWLSATAAAQDPTRPAAWSSYPSSQAGQAEGTGQPLPPLSQASASQPSTPSPSAPAAANTPASASGPEAPSAPAAASLPTDAVGCDRLAQVCCGGCGPAGRGWVTVDYTLWAVQSSSTPALLVRDAPGTARSAVGIPGTPGQQVVSGNARLTGDLRSGFQIGAGYWLDDCHRWAVSADFFFLSTGTDNGRFGSPGNLPLSRPFFNIATGAPDAELVAYPGVLSGTATVLAHNTFDGAGVFLQRNLCCGDLGCDPCRPSWYRIDFLAGYRYYQLNDFLEVRENLVATGANAPGGVPAGTSIVVTDRFSTNNTFNGALLGLSGSGQYGKWVFAARGGAALGDMYRELVVDGSTVVTVPGLPASTRSGGLLAQATNMGRFASDTFTVAPELNLTLGYQLNRWASVHVGYTFVYLPNVWRAGDQIDRRVDPAQLTGGVGTLGHPGPVLASTGAAIQGMNFGITFRY